MNYSIRVSNIQGRVNVVKVLRALHPGMSLVAAKNHVWGKDLVNFSAIRKERNPGVYDNDYVFTEAERALVLEELGGLAAIWIEQLPLDAEKEKKEILRKTLSFAASWALKRVAVMHETFCKLSSEELDELEEEFKKFANGI